MGAGFTGDLSRRFVGDGAFTEDGRDMLLLHGVDGFTHLLRRALLVGVNRPQITLLQAVIARQIGECAFAGDQPAFVRRPFRQFGLQRRHSLADLLFVGLGVTAIGVGIDGIVFHQCIANVIDVNQRIIRRHPGVRIRFAVVGAIADAHRLDTVADHHFRYAVQVLIKTGEPQFEVETVGENKLRPLRAFDIARRRLIFVNFRARLGD